MSDEKSARESWQSQGAEAQPPSMDEVRKAAGKFYRRIWWRNAVEYAAAVFVVVSFSYNIAVGMGHVLERIGSAVAIIGVLFVVWQLHHRGSPSRPETAGSMPLMDFVREQLVRQRDTLTSAAWWYLAPLVPGMLLILVGATLRKMADGTGTIMIGFAGFGFCAILFFGAWLIHRWGARRLQRHIDDIDALVRGNAS